MIDSDNHLSKTGQNEEIYLYEMFLTHYHYDANAKDLTYEICPSVQEFLVSIFHKNEEALERGTDVLITYNLIGESGLR